MENPAYQSPGCHFIDRLESAATLQQLCTIRYSNSDSAAVTTRTRIVDVYTEAGADWCKLEDGTIVRLDRIKSLEIR